MENGSFRVVARVGDRKTSPPPKERRFPAGTALRTMKGWQEDRRAELRRENLRPVLGTLSADVERYLAKPEVTKLGSYKARLSDCRAWLPELGHLRRDQIETAYLQHPVDDWLGKGVKPWTVRHRLNALRQIYKVLDGVGAFNPALDVKAPPKPRAIPRALDYDVIRSTLNHMEPSATKGLLMIMAFCGFRPVEIRRTEQWMIRLDSENPPCDPKHGQRG
jgi:site-specific recombinase XerC